MWSYDGHHWKLLKAFAPDASVAELCEFNDRLYVGIWNFTAHLSSVFKEQYQYSCWFKATFFRTDGVVDFTNDAGS